MFDFKYKERIEKINRICDETVRKYGGCGILAPPLPAQEAMDILIKHLLGPNWYTMYSCGAEQVNMEAVAAIIERYKEVKK